MRDILILQTEQLINTLKKKKIKSLPASLVHSHVRKH